jgi:ribose transport system ATP-binding protein
MLEEAPILQARGISKDFPGVRALDNVDFDVYPGEVHVLIGENGAGKSTLGKILMGAYTQDSGELLLHGKPISIRRPLEALRHGIGGVHQEFMLVPWLNVAQNIFLNREPRYWGVVINHRRMHQESRRLLESLDVHINTRQPLKHFGTAIQQMVELCKVLAANPRILILDEPTAVLTEPEVQCLFRRIKELRQQGVAIIFISHRLQEIREIGDRVTVLRDGKHVASGLMKDFSNDELVHIMVGRNISQMYPRHYQTAGDEVLRLKKLSIKGGPKNVDLVVRKGEIVGIAGLVGSGRTEVAQAVFGIRQIESGEVILFGKKVTPRSPAEMVRRSVGLIPEDRKLFGLTMKFSLAWNVVMASLRLHFPHFLVSDTKVKRVADRFVKELRIVTPSVTRKVRFLSGGNQQKVVLAKWLDTESELLIFDEPTRGIDIGAKVEIHSLMDNLVQKGKAVLMISSDLPEVLGMSDVVYVMYHGEIRGKFSHDEATQDQIASVMLGVSAATEATSASVASPGETKAAGTGGAV